MIDWEEAPEGATHCWNKHKGEWRKVTEDNVFWWSFKRKAWIPFIIHPDAWLANHGNHVVARPVAKKAVVKKPVVKIFVPLVAGEVLTIDKLKTTRAYEQMVNFIKNNNGTPAQLGVLVKKFLREFNLQKDNMTQDVVFQGRWFEAFNDDNSISRAFFWRAAKEGYLFWGRVAMAQNVGNLAVFLKGEPPAIGQPVRMPPPAPPVVPAVEFDKVGIEVKKKVGWW